MAQDTHKATLVWKPWPELENHDLQQRGTGMWEEVGGEGWILSQGLWLQGPCVSMILSSLMQWPLVPHSGESPESVLFKCVARRRDQF